MNGIRYEVKDIPPNLPPGKYGARVTDECRWEKGDLVIVLVYDSNLSPDDCLLPFTIQKV
jgi:hypothetical protein